MENKGRTKRENFGGKYRDDDETRLKLNPHYVKYSIPPKHQVWKQKGEEYRLHGTWGWIWLSNFRPAKPKDARSLGLLKGPHQHVIQVMGNTKKVKTMIITRDAYEKLMEKRRSIAAQEKTNGGALANKPMEVDSERNHSKGGSGDRKPAKFREKLIDVSLGIASRNRILYPRIAREVKSLDTLLARRIHLQTKEETDLLEEFGAEMLESVKGPPPEMDKRPIIIHIDGSFPLAGGYSRQCYSYQCQVAAKEGKYNFEASCYSPICRLKSVIMEAKRRKLEKEKIAELEKAKKARIAIQERRLYNQSSTSEKVFLKKLPEEMKRNDLVKYPISSKLTYNSTKKPSLFVLARHERMKLARTAGRAVSTAALHKENTEVLERVGETNSAKGLNVACSAATQDNAANTADSGIPTQVMNQGVQIFESPDGKLQAKKLMPGQKAFRITDNRVPAVSSTIDYLDYKLEEKVVCQPDTENAVTIFQDLSVVQAPSNLTVAVSQPLVKVTNPAVIRTVISSSITPPTPPSIRPAQYAVIRMPTVVKQNAQPQIIAVDRTAEDLKGSPLRFQTRRGILQLTINDVTKSETGMDQIILGPGLPVIQLLPPASASNPPPLQETELVSTTPPVADNSSIQQQQPNLTAVQEAPATVKPADPEPTTLTSAMVLAAYGKVNYTDADNHSYTLDLAGYSEESIAQVLEHVREKKIVIKRVEQPKPPPPPVSQVHQQQFSIQSTAQREQVFVQQSNRLLIQQPFGSSFAPKNATVLPQTPQIAAAAGQPASCFQQMPSVTVPNDALCCYYNGSLSESSNAEVKLFCKYFMSQSLSDLKISAGQETFPGHRFVLSERSFVFKAMFEVDEKSELQSGVIRIEDFDAQIVKEFLEFLYTGNCDALLHEDASHVEIAMKLFQICHKYDAPSMIKKCEDFLTKTLNVENVVKVFKLADFLGVEGLAHAAKEFFRSNRPEVVPNLDVLRHMIETYTLEIIYKLDFAHHG